jgi:deazaflavin-dependent oxidoreductase (nitroreductase family)
VPKPPSASSPFWKLFNVGTGLNTTLYRLSGGRLGGHLGKAPVLLLHHVGRRSGEERISPVVYLEDGDNLVIVASKGGVDTNPAWFHNLMASPGTTVEVGRERRHVTARLASPEERAGFWPRLVEMYPSFESYQGWTNREEIPVLVLEPGAG